MINGMEKDNEGRFVSVESVCILIKHSKARKVSHRGEKRDDMPAK